VNGVPVIYYKNEVKGIGKTVQNKDGSVSGSYKAVSFSPEEIKSLNNSKTALEKSLRESIVGYDANFADKLEKCEPYKYQFKHPFTGTMMERQIVGEVNGRCLYIEQMPNGGKMECQYSESQRKSVAKSYRDMHSAMSSGSNEEISIHGTLKGITAKAKLNGKDVKNPLQEALDCGDCVISGYGQLSPKIK
jgi:hypothetical protein